MIVSCFLKAFQQLESVWRRRDDELRLFYQNILREKLRLNLRLNFAAHLDSAEKADHDKASG